MILFIRLRRAALSAVLLCVLCVSAAGAAEVRKLPTPQTSGGLGIFDMLKNRASATAASFPTGKISQEELSTLLWAATGLNRPEKGWTVPMAMGREPYCRVYVTGEEGTFLYDWVTHSLIGTSKEDGRRAIGAMSFASNAPYILIFVTDGKSIGSFKNVRAAEDWAQVAVGAMTQNVYLAAEALGIGTRYMASLKEDAVRTACALDADDVPVCILPLGKR